MEGEGISNGFSAEMKVETRVIKNGRKVIVEKSAAEGLPEGWMKKLVISNRSGRKRRDPFFIDPKSEYIFPSFKAASRYVETGDIGHYARKFKDSHIQDDDSGNGKNNVLPLESAEALLEKEKNIDISKRRRNSSSENIKMNSDLSSVTSQVLEELEKKNKDVNDPIENQPLAKRVTRSQTKASKTEEDVDVKSRLTSASAQSPEKKSVMDVRDSTEKGIMRSKAIAKKNELTSSVARRASKRLAGIELEPTPELKTRAKAQRVVVVPLDDDGKQPVNPIAATSGFEKMDVPLTKEVAKSDDTQHSSPEPNAAASTSMKKQIEKSGRSVGRSGGSGDRKKMKMPQMTYELNPFFRLDGYKEKEEMSPVSPLSRQTSATKREKKTAGNKVTSPKATEISPLRSSNRGEHPHPYDNGSATKRRNKSCVVKGTCSEVMEMNNTNSFSSTAFESTLADLWKDPCIAFAIKTLTGEDTLRLPNNTAAVSSDTNSNHAKKKGVAFLPETPQNANIDHGKPGVSSELPGMDIWKDPCIDFAIKTLTGAIPIGLNEPKPEGMTITASARKEQEGRQSSSSSCDYLVQQCSNNMKNKTMGKPGDQRSFSRD